MKKIFILSVLCLFSFLSVFADEPLKKNADGTYVVNTTSLTRNVKGYMGNTPLEIYIKGDKIQKITPLKNNETPSYFKRVVNGVISKYVGQTVKKALKSDVDAVSGATYSSNAVKENIEAGLKYYQNNKKKVK